MKYVLEKNKINKILYTHYQQEFFRKFKLYNCCHQELDKFVTRASNKPKDKKKNNKILVNGLLKYTLSNPEGELNQNTIMYYYS